MCHTRRLDLKASALELVLSVDLAVILPGRSFGVASRDRLYVSCIPAGRLGTTDGMMRDLLRDVAIPVRNGVFEALAQEGVEGLGDPPNR